MTTIRQDDNRHGTNAGYVAGCHCDRCGLAHFRANKERNLYAARHGACLVPHADVAVLVEPWFRMGISTNALANAAKLGKSSSFHKTYHAGSPAFRSTYARLARVTEDDFDGDAFVYADLTRTRIFSLIAAGHRLMDMPILNTGRWRDHERITIKQARDIRDHFRALEATMGPNKQKASQARNAGHMPPLAWDDPDTLAWPDGPPTQLGDTAVRVQGVDGVKVDRVVSGIAQDCNTAERYAVIERWEGSIADLQSLTGWHVYRMLASKKVA